jgi:hypothetical protein
MMNLEDVVKLVEILVGIGTLISLAVAIVTLRHTRESFRRQMNAQTYLAYTERYEKCHAGCPPEFRTEWLPKDLSEIPDGERPRVKEYMVRYLNLCSEEHYLMRAGYIAREVWSVWEAEIERTLRTPLYRSGWQQVRAEFHDLEFIELVERAQKSSPGP